MSALLSTPHPAAGVFPATPTPTPPDAAPHPHLALGWTRSLAGHTESPQALCRVCRHNRSPPAPGPMQHACSQPCCSLPSLPAPPRCAKEDHENNSSFFFFSFLLYTNIYRVLYTSLHRQCQSQRRSPRAAPQGCRHRDRGTLGRVGGTGSRQGHRYRYRINILLAPAWDPAGSSHLTCPPLEGLASNTTLLHTSTCSSPGLPSPHLQDPHFIPSTPPFPLGLGIL